jgi:hypothetical protein
MKEKKKHGRPRNIETPERLLELFEEYIEYAKANPMHRVHYNDKKDKQVDVPLHVPITFLGFELYLYKTYKFPSLSNYEDGTVDGFKPTIRYIRDYCFENNFAGAAVGLFNARLISTRLGLIAKQQVVTVEEQPLFPENQ